MPPFIIFAGVHHLEAWHQEDLPHNWVAELSQNGWKTNDLGLDRLRNFNQHRQDRTTGVYRLLSQDGHKSHCGRHHSVTIAQTSTSRCCLCQPSEACIQEARSKPPRSLRRLPHRQIGLHGNLPTGSINWITRTTGSGGSTACANR